MEIPAKPRVMVEALRERIYTGELPGGARMPSIRSLMERYALSYGSAKRGVDYLCRTGLLEKRPRSGVHVARRAPAPAVPHARTVGVLTGKSDLRSRAGIFATVFTGIYTAAEEAGCSLLVNHLPVRDATPERVRDLCRRVEGLVMLAEYDETFTEVSLPVPVVGVCMHRAACVGMSLFDIDPFGAAELATEYFHRRNVTRVAVVTDNLDMHVFRNRCAVFSAGWTAAGGAVTAIVHESDFQGVEPDTGYLFATSTLLQRCSERVLKHTGRTLAEQAVVVGIDGKNLADSSHHPAPAITTDWRAVGAGALDECLRRIAEPGRPPRRVYFRAWFVDPAPDGRPALPRARANAAAGLPPDRPDEARGVMQPTQH